MHFAGPVALLASPLGSFCTGAYLPADGGVIMPSSRFTSPGASHQPPRPARPCRAIHAGASVHSRGDHGSCRRQDGEAVPCAPWDTRIGRFTVNLAAQQTIAQHPHAGYFSAGPSFLIVAAYAAVAVAAAALVITRRDA